MLSRGFTSEPTVAEHAVLDEMSGVLVEHLEHWRERRREGKQPTASPVLIQIDGTGRTLFLDKLARQLDPEVYGEESDKPPPLGRWTVIRFDAWQYQRVAPPWWWLIKTIDTQLRARVKHFGRFWEIWRWRARDYGWRFSHVLADIAVALPALAIAALLGVTAWLLSGKDEFLEILEWVSTALAAITALLALGWSATNALRRHLLVASPAGARAVLQTSDPMRELTERYAWLIRQSGTEVAVLIDNLDRCRADYVVELLEGVQTLFKAQARAKALPLVLFVIAADRAWLCDSYLTVYNEFEAATREPGRPFGQAFLDKVFDLSLRIPTVSAAISQSSENAQQHGLAEKAAQIENAQCELDVRVALAALERADVPADARPALPNQELRRVAVQTLARLERFSSSKACTDTEEYLRELTARVEPGPTTVRHLAAAYCVQRTVQLLAGHEFDSDGDAIRRLGLWTVLTLRWPVLATWLERHPHDIDGLSAGQVAEEAGDEIEAVFALPDARRLGGIAKEVGLDADAVTRFTQPIDVYRYAQRPRAAAPA